MQIGRALVAMGLLLAGVGVLVMLSDKLPFKLGRLPGDIAIEGKNGGGFYFPVVTCLVISAVLTLLSWVIGKLR
ncbi:MAG: DUF2905 domain-containing protein [Acidobacteria bacterium]|nr:DUF2905 domain-containing protein [Acidobacteriota bacterium]